MNKTKGFAALVAGLSSMVMSCGGGGSGFHTSVSGDGGGAGATAGPACMAFEAACPGVSIGSMMTQL